MADDVRQGPPLFLPLMLFFASVVIFWLGFWAALTYGDVEPIEPREQMQLELDAYRACMANAARLGCRMEVEDFMRYHEIRHKLEGADSD